MTTSRCKCSTCPWSLFPGPCSLEREQVRVLHHHAAPGRDCAAVGVLLLVVDDEEVAERPVDQVEAQVGRELLDVSAALTLMCTVFRFGP